MAELFVWYIAIIVAAALGYHSGHREATRKYLEARCKHRP